MNDILSKIGFTPEIEYAEVKTKEDSEAEGFSSYTYIDPATGEDGFVTNRYKFINIPSKFPAINGKHPVMDAFVGVRNKNRDKYKNNT